MNRTTRRQILKFAGGGIMALPLLESFAPKFSKAATDEQRYAIFFRQANGVNAAADNEPERFWPQELGALDAQNLQGRALDELTAHASKLLVVRNVNMENFDYGDGHARGAMQGLTARGPVVEAAGGESEAAGESIDHRIGRQLNAAGRESVFLYSGDAGGWLGGACISYRGAGERRSALRSPWTAYQTIAGGDTPQSQEALELAMARQQSINDLVRGQLNRLMNSPRLSEADRQRLDLHFTSVRDLEVALGCQLSASDQQLIETGSELVDSNAGDDLVMLTKLHMDVAVMAVACGYTRSVAIQFGNGNDGSTRFRDPDTGQEMENFHYISHRQLSHGSDGAPIPDADLLHHKCDRYFGQMFEHLVARLDAYPMPDGGTLLDAGLSVWYNDNGTGPAHSPNNIPYVIAGSANGALKQGQYLEVSGDGVNHNKMLNTLASAVGATKDDGAPLDDFGDPSFEPGLLTELMV